MVLIDKNRRQLPPYVSYRTFRNFVDGLLQGIPARIDRSYWGERLSGSTGVHLMAALRFLNLVDSNGMPTNRLRQVVSTTGERKAETFREMTTESYHFVFHGSFDPQTGTFSQLQEAFYNEFMLTGDVSRKCIKFFVALSNDSGINLSPFIAKRFRSGRSGTGTKAVVKKISVRTNQTAIVPQTARPMPLAVSWEEMLLSKFPTFDPAWTDEVKLKWFDAYDELLKRGMIKEEK